jgi:ABC-2 type transport system ATP-binding protein
MDAVIAVSHLTKRYRACAAVNDLSFDVAPGEVVGLVGPNGAGKTSTLRCIVGIQAPSAGHVALGGHDIVTDGVEARRRLALMADEPMLFDYLTVMEHLRLVLAGRSFSQSGQTLVIRSPDRSTWQREPSCRPRNP